MSNAGQINNSTNNSQQKKPVWFWVVTVVSFQFLFGSIAVLANLAQIADSLQEFCKEYDINIIEGVCDALKEKQRKKDIESSSLPPISLKKSEASSDKTDAEKEVKPANTRKTSSLENQIRFKRAN